MSLLCVKDMNDKAVIAGQIIVTVHKFWFDRNKLVKPNNHQLFPQINIEQPKHLICSY